LPFKWYGYFIPTAYFQTTMTVDIQILSNKYAKLFGRKGPMIEAPRSKLRGIFGRKDFLSVFDSLAHPAAAAENALAVSVQRFK
jgi:predicted RNA-binding protein YlqC (UPF0109 family)